MSEKISIITISFNSEKTIERTMQSVLAQSYRPLEYVLVDGGSKDGTIDLIEAYIPKFQSAGIEVSFKSEPDKGISDAFNKGIARATGDIIGIINSDDQLAENALSYVAETFDAETDVVCGDCLWIDEVNHLEYIRKSRMELDKLKYQMVLMHPTCFVRKTAYDSYGVFDVDLHYVMDKDLMARFYKNGVRFKYTPNVLAIMSSGGASDINVDKVYQEGITVALRNGVPKWRMLVRLSFNKLRYSLIKLAKRNKRLWESIREK